jgi:hypothetical protein
VTAIVTDAVTSRTAGASCFSDGLHRSHPRPGNRQ